MGVIGAYDLLVNCDGPHEPWAKPTIKVCDQNYTACIKEVRQAGWKIVRDGSVSQWGEGKAYCPDCHEKKVWDQ